MGNTQSACDEKCEQRIADKIIERMPSADRIAELVNYHSTCSSGAQIRDLEQKIIRNGDNLSRARKDLFEQNEELRASFVCPTTPNCPDITEIKAQIEAIVPTRHDIADEVLWGPEFSVYAANTGNTTTTSLGYLVSDIYMQTRNDNHGGPEFYSVTPHHYQAGRVFDGE